MARLHRSCRRLLWLNPLLRYDGFEPRASGIALMLPHVDAFLPVHNLASLEALAVALTRSGEGREPAGSGRRFVEAFRPAGGRRPRKRRGAA
jgi:hypothetical protein